MSPVASTSDPGPDAGTAETPARNEVVLRGRVAAPADERELPSGDTIVTARLVVDRDSAALGRSAQRVDTIDCVAWLRRVQRSMRGWEQGERVEVTGAIRRRFFRGATGPVSRVEVEIRTVTRLDKKSRRSS
jgi:single-strand DNA-binding protein